MFLFLSTRLFPIAMKRQRTVWYWLLGTGLLALVSCSGNPPQSNTFSLSSANLSVGQPIPALYTCQEAVPQVGGNGVSPALNWKNTPLNAQGFAITVHDPDAVGSFFGGFLHWLVINIPANITNVPRGAGGGPNGGAGVGLPSGAVQIQNDFGDIKYGGPCPPAGTTHNYRFSVWALRANPLPGGITAASTAAEVSAALTQYSMGKADFYASYKLAP